MNTGKAIPWVLSALLAGGCAYSWFAGKQKHDSMLAEKNAVITEQAAQLQKITAQYDALVKEANERLDSLAKEASEKLAFANLPVVPVKLSTTKPFFDSGLALVIRNESEGTVAIKLSVERPTTGQAKEFEFTIDTGFAKSVGQSEGWAFIAGDKAIVTQASHKPITFTVQ